MINEPPNKEVGMYQLAIYQMEEEMENFKQQLAEKDKEIKSLKEEIEDETDFKNEYYKYWQDLKKEMTKKNKEIGELKFKLANQRHQICEKIREQVEKMQEYGEIYVGSIYDILDQIEKGE